MGGRFRSVLPSDLRFVVSPPPLPAADLCVFSSLRWRLFLPLISSSRPEAPPPSPARERRGPSRGSRSPPPAPRTLLTSSGPSSRCSSAATVRKKQQRAHGRGVPPRCLLITSDPSTRRLSTLSKCPDGSCACRRRARRVPPLREADGAGHRGPPAAQQDGVRRAAPR